ncbi:hypothetical protein DRP07_11150 [Archaeoglobales archaeon]|nr:MAG: hypothetical protein DRP07_11150 [Archaeoglobales archaeon]
MKFRRTLPIVYRIVTKEDLEKLIATALEDIPPEEKIILSIEGDKKTYEINTVSEALEVPEILENERVIGIKLTYYSTDRGIDIRLYHKKDYNYIDIRGTEKKWVDAKCKEFEDMVNTWKSHNKLVYIFSTPNAVLAVYSVLIIVSLMLLIYPLAYKLLLLLKLSQRAQVGVGTTIAWVIAMILNFYIFHIMEELFPVVEIQTGPDHLQHEKYKRRKLGVLFAIVIIPTILNILLYMIFK